MKKNVQIPLQIFLNLSYLLTCCYKTDGLREKDLKLHEDVKEFFRDKGSRLRNEVAYTEYVRAPQEKKDEALDLYLQTKKLRF